ncbi:MAG: hypothetical protein EXS63_08770 [Candidatus Omnitrophica bacterium]|nr:hypothetical protein [Candidatus Omnitrophota bacterium]
MKRVIFICSFFILGAPLYGETSGDLLFFHSAAIQSGTEVKPGFSREADLGTSKKSSQPIMDVYAEGLLSQGKKQAGVETTELEELGVASSDILVSSQPDGVFAVEMVLSFQHWGGKKTDARQKFFTVKNSAAKFLARPEIKIFHQTFTELVMREMAANPRTSAPDFLGQFPGYFRRFLQELALKQQTGFLSAVQDYARKEKAYYVKEKVKINKVHPPILSLEEEEKSVASSTQSVSDTEPTEEASEESIWSQLHEDAGPPPEYETPVRAEQKSAEEIKPVPPMLEKRQTKREDKPVVESARLPEAIPADRLREKEKTSTLLQEKEHLRDENAEIPPDVLREPDKPLPLRGARKTVEAISKGKPGLVPAYRQVVTPLRSLAMSDKKNTATYKTASALPPSFQSRTPYHSLLASYQMLKGQREKVGGRSQEYIELSKMMAGIKNNLQTLGYYRQKSSKRNAMERDVAIQLVSDMLVPA